MKRIANPRVSTTCARMVLTANMKRTTQPFRIYPHSNVRVVVSKDQRPYTWDTIDTASRFSTIGGIEVVNIAPERNAPPSTFGTFRRLTGRSETRTFAVATPLNSKTNCDVHREEDGANLRGRSIRPIPMPGTSGNLDFHDKRSQVLIIAASAWDRIFAYNCAWDCR